MGFKNPILLLVFIKHKYSSDLVALRNYFHDCLHLAFSSLSTWNITVNTMFYNFNFVLSLKQNKKARLLYTCLQRLDNLVSPLSNIYGKQLG